MDFSLKRWGAHFCPPPIWAAKKACFLPPFQVFGHVAHMFFRFLLHRFRVFLHDFCIFSHLFVKFSACANANWQISGVICCVFRWSSHANFAIICVKIPQWGIKMIKFIPHWGNFSEEFIPHWGIICIFAAVLNDIHLKEQDMIDGAWNHHPSLVLRNELLESWTFACGLRNSMSNAKK